jgi:hypothetical protein
MRLYVGHFASGVNEQRVRSLAKRQRVGGKPIGVYGLDDVVDLVIKEAAPKGYRDNAVLVTLKVLDAAGRLREPPT